MSDELQFVRVICCQNGLKRSNVPNVMCFEVGLSGKYYLGVGLLLHSRAHQSLPGGEMYLKVGGPA